MWWFYDHPRPWSWLCFVFLTLATFSLYELLAPGKTKPIVLELAGMKWTREDFCRGWLITGATGCGKTASIMMRILFGLCTHVPDWGGMALDDKGPLLSHSRKDVPSLWTREAPSSDSGAARRRSFRLENRPTPGIHLMTKPCPIRLMPRLFATWRPPFPAIPTHSFPRWRKLPWNTPCEAWTWPIIT